MRVRPHFRQTHASASDTTMRTLRAPVRMFGRPTASQFVICRRETFQWLAYSAKVQIVRGGSCRGVGESAVCFLLRFGITVSCHAQSLLCAVMWTVGSPNVSSPTGTATPPRATKPLPLHRSVTLLPPAEVIVGCLILPQRGASQALTAALSAMTFSAGCGGRVLNHRCASSSLTISR